MLRRSPKDRPLYRAIWLVVQRPIRLLFRMRIEGLEHIPADGPVLIACNHVSNLDPIFLGVAANRQIHFMAKSTLWSFKPVGRLIDVLGSFPVRRGEADREAIRSAIMYLDEAATVGIFPEGRRQLDGRLGDPMPGFALLALREGIATIPAVLTGTDRIARGRLPRAARVTVRFGPPLDVQSVEGAKGRRQAVVGARLKDAWSRMLGLPPEPAGG